MVEGVRSNASTSEAGEEVRDGLVRRQILTKKGNRVWRWVKPNNANVVVEAARGLGLAAARATRRAKVVVPPPETPVAPPKKFAISSLAGCCGARVAVPEPQKEAAKPPKTDEELREEYEKLAMFAHWKTYSAHLAVIQKALDQVAKGEKITGYYAGYEKRGMDDLRYLKDDLVAYQGYVKRFSFETYKKSGDTTASKVTYYPGVSQQNGIVVSTEEFPNSKQTPAGLWVRCDYTWEWGDKRVSTPDKPSDKPVIKPNTGGSVTKYDGYCPGLRPLYLASQDMTAASIWGAIKREKYKEGDVVVFIRTDRQMSPVRAQEMAAAGFHCCLVTGNRNHPGRSILYLYERRLTKDDIKALKKVVKDDAVA